jgi:membrane protease YdiL (CAAX protease family)
MISSRTAFIVLVGFLLLGPVGPSAGDVIAAAPPIDQPAAGAAMPGAASSRVSSGALLAALYGALSIGVLAIAIRGRRLSLVQAPPRPEAFSAGVAMALLLVMVGMAQLGAWAVRSRWLAGAAETPADAMTLAEHARLALGAYGANALVLIPIVWLFLRATPPAPDRRRSVVGAALLGVVFMGVLWPIVQVVGLGSGMLSELVSGAPPDALAHQTLRRMIESPRDVWFTVMVVAVVIVAPLLEETMYRGLVQQAMRQVDLPPWVAIALTSGVFVLMHLSIAAPHAMAPLFVLSLGFGWAYERTGRLAAPIVMHMLFNLANLMLAMVGRG